MADLLPLAGELVAAALTSGADPGSALRAVAAAVGDPLGGSLDKVARALDLGSPAEDAWADLMADPVSAALARPMVRAAATGAPSARSLARMSAELRRQASARAAHRAEVVGVRAVGPLGLCFLPAFVVLGVIPFVAGSVRSLLAG
jgi:pilus assembly protein TadC